MFLADRDLDFAHCPVCGSSLDEDLLGFDPRHPDAEVTACHGILIVRGCTQDCLHDDDDEEEDGDFYEDD